VLSLLLCRPPAYRPGHSITVVPTKLGSANRCGLRAGRQRAPIRYRNDSTAVKSRQKPRLSATRKDRSWSRRLQDPLHTGLVRRPQHCRMQCLQSLNVADLPQATEQSSGRVREAGDHSVLNRSFQRRHGYLRLCPLQRHLCYRPLLLARRRSCSKAARAAARSCSNCTACACSCSVTRSSIR